MNRAASSITDYGQNQGIITTWQNISGMTTGALLEAIFSLLGKNPCSPAGKDFTEFFSVVPPDPVIITPGSPELPFGSLANTADRWHWIRSETQDGILDTWNDEGLSRKLALTNAPLRLDAHRFSTLSATSAPTGTLVPIKCWDDEDAP